MQPPGVHHMSLKTVRRDEALAHLGDRKTDLEARFVGEEQADHSLEHNKNKNRRAIIPDLTI